MCLFWVGKAAKVLEKKTKLRKKAKGMWVVQVSNREEGVKNLSVVQAKNEMEITAADSVSLSACGVGWSGRGRGGSRCQRWGTRASPVSLPPGMLSSAGLEAIVSPA